MKKLSVVLAGVAIVVMASGGAANAQIGVGTMWTGGGVFDAMVLPIMFGEGMVLEPSAQVFSISNGASFTEIGLGISIEKHMREGTSPLFGGMAMVDIGSPDEGDSWTNFGFGVFIGGTAELGDNVDIVGKWGPTIGIYAEESPVYTDATVIQSEASITLRWWLWGE
jgi:hypothetical protein